MSVIWKFTTLFLAACAGPDFVPLEAAPAESVTAPKTGEITFTRDGLEISCPDNCCLANAHGIGGAFVVTEIERSEDGRALSLGFESTQAWSANVPGTFTLNLIHAWDPAHSSGERRAARLFSTLTVGDSVGLLFEVDPTLPGEVTVPEQFIFRRVAHGGFSNGLLFTQAPQSLDSIGATFGQSYDEIAAGVACRVTASADWQDALASPPGEWTPIPPFEPVPLDPDFADPE